MSRPVLHNPADYRCSRRCFGEPLDDNAVCPVCAPAVPGVDVSVERLLETIQGWREEGLGWCPDIERTNHPDAMRDIFEAASAVPVVQPEPAGRPLDQYLLPKARQDAWDAVRAQAGEEWLAANFQVVDAALWNAAPAIVAAAAAAVRADLAAQIEAARWRQPAQSSTYCLGRSVGMAEARDIAAAAVRSATKEGLG